MDWLLKPWTPCPVILSLSVFNQFSLTQSVFVWFAFFFCTVFMGFPSHSPCSRKLCCQFLAPGWIKCSCSFPECYASLVMYRLQPATLFTWIALFGGQPASLGKSVASEVQCEWFERSHFSVTRCTISTGILGIRVSGGSCESRVEARPKRRPPCYKKPWYWLSTGEGRVEERFYMFKRKLEDTTLAYWHA